MKNLSTVSFRRALSALLLLIVAQSMSGIVSASTRSSVSAGYFYQGSYYVTITGNSVIGRDGPGGVDTGMRFNKGARLLCVGSSGSWYQCRVNGNYVWVSSAYAKRAGRTTSNTYYNGTVVITGDRVIGRATPGGADTGKRFYKGQQLGYGGSNGSWLKVYSGGKAYWVSQHFAYVR